MGLNRAVFFDRDGVINRVIMRGDVPSGPREIADFEFCEGIKDTVDSIKKLGYLIIVITNQPDIERGFLKIEELEKMNQMIVDYLGVDDILFCPHDGSVPCVCRKPAPGMLFEAARRYDLVINKSWMIGDRQKDMVAGTLAGCRAILLNASYNQAATGDFRARDLKDCLRIIKENDGVY